MDSTKLTIIDMYYNKHIKPTVIANELNVSNPYVSQIIKIDIRYKEEKLYRKEQTRIKHSKDTCNYIKKKRKADKELDDFVRLQHRQATEELSYKPEISDEAFRKWNSSSYTYNSKKKRYEINKSLKSKISAYAPRTIKNKIAIPKLPRVSCY